MLIGYDPGDQNRVLFLNSDTKYLAMMEKVKGRPLEVSDFWGNDSGLISVHVEEIPKEKSISEYGYTEGVGFFELGPKPAMVKEQDPIDIINMEVVSKIRSQYSENDEYKMHRLAIEALSTGLPIPQIYLDYQEFVKQCVDEGKIKKQSLEEV